MNAHRSLRASYIPTTSAPGPGPTCHVCTGTVHGRYLVGLVVAVDLVKLLQLLFIVFEVLRCERNPRGIPRGRFAGKSPITAPRASQRANVLFSVASYRPPWIPLGSMDDHILRSGL